MLSDRPVIGAAVLDAMPDPSSPSDSTHWEIWEHWRQPHFKMQRMVRSSHCVNWPLSARRSFERIVWVWHDAVVEIESRVKKMGSRKNSSQRPGRSGLTRDMLLPLPTEKVRALSLENHLALATVRGGRGDLDQVSCLVRVVYLAFYLRDTTSAGADFDLYRRAEAALNACVTRAEQGARCLLLDHELSTVERLLVVHDEQLAAAPWHRYLDAWKRLQHYIVAGKRSPIAVAAGT